MKDVPFILSALLPFSRERVYRLLFEKTPEYLENSGNPAPVFLSRSDLDGGAHNTLHWNGLEESLASGRISEGQFLETGGFCVG